MTRFGRSPANRPRSGRSWHVCLVFLLPVAAGCRGQFVLRQPLAASLVTLEDWTSAVDGFRAAPIMIDDLPSTATISLGVFSLAGIEEKIACAVSHDFFVVHVSIVWFTLRGRTLRPPPSDTQSPPEIHCRVLDSEGRPLRFLGVTSMSIAKMYSYAVRRKGSFLELVFKRAGRDIGRARVIVTTEEGEWSFDYRDLTAGLRYSGDVDRIDAPVDQPPNNDPAPSAPAPPNDD